MRCESCGIETPDGESYNWVAGKQLSSVQVGGGVRSAYGDFVHIEVFLCFTCFDREKRKQSAMRWARFFASLLFLPVWFYMMTWFSLEEGVLGTIAVIATVVVVLAPFVLAGAIKRARRKVGQPEETATVLQPFCAEKVRRLGRSHYWKDDDFKELMLQQAGR